MLGLLIWSVRLELHQHLSGYEPDALAVKLQTREGEAGWWNTGVVEC